MTDGFNWDTLPEPETAERNIRPDRPKDIPSGIQKMVQTAFEKNERCWMTLPDKEVAVLFLMYVRAAGDHTTKDGALYPTTVLANYAKTDKDGKEIPKSKERKVVTYIVTERRGAKAKAGDENPAETETENTSETESADAAK